MGNDKRIAIVTLYDNVNIGNRLQNYAVQEILRKKGADVISLACDAPPLIGWKAKLAMALHIPGKAIAWKRKQKERYERFCAFTDKWIRTESPCRFSDRLDGTVSTEADAFVVGSDQVWHNWKKTDEELSYFFLEFVPEQKRICFAPSFGFDEFPPEKREHYARGLNGFRHLSCREQSGCDLIHAATGREAVLLIDPTMMLTADEWDMIAKKPDYTVEKRFMLVYFLGEKSPEAKAEIARLAKEQQLQIIDVLSREALAYYATTPDEFVYLVKNAAMVCTDSFHGCVFSILYKKEFRCFDRSGALGAQMANRQKTLIQKFGVFNEAGNCDYSKADEILEGERAKATAYLDAALADIE